MSRVPVISPTLFDLAEWRVSNAREKQAFVPAGQDPAAGGDPAAAAGGMPPGGDPAAAMGGAPPMDPSMGGGGAPPMDPMAGGAAPPGLDPMMMQQIVQAVMQQMGGGGAAPGGMPGAPGAAPGPAGPGKGSAKVDPGLIYMELGRLRKLMTGMYQNLDWELPPDILDDQMVAQTVAGGQPMGQPLPPGGAPAGGAPAPAAAAPPSLPGIGQSGAISPIEPAGGAPGGAPKTAAADDILATMGLQPRTGRELSPAAFGNANQRIDDLAALARSLNNANA